MPCWKSKKGLCLGIQNMFESHSSKEPTRCKTQWKNGESWTTNKKQKVDCTLENKYRKKLNRSSRIRFIRILLLLPRLENGYWLVVTTLNVINACPVNEQRIISIRHEIVRYLSNITNRQKLGFKKTSNKLL